MKTIQRNNYFNVNADKNRENLENVINILEKKTKFEGFLHYTDITNIKNIIENKKLFSRAKSIDFISTDAASKDVLDHTDVNILEYVRFYYKENTPTIFNNEGIKLSNTQPHMPIPVLLVFDKNIIFHNNVAFLNGGGGSNYSKFTKDSYEVLNFEWDSILYRGPLQRSDDLMTEEDRKNKLKINNYRNAEFLYKDSISTEFIKKIYFRSMADLKQFNIINEGKLKCNLEVKPNKFFCKRENDFLYDYNIEILNNSIIYLGLIFHTFQRDFTHKLSLKLKNRLELLDFRLDKDLNNNEIKKLPIPKRLVNYDYYIEIDIQDVEEILFYVNGHLSLFWRRKTND